MLFWIVIAYVVSTPIAIWVHRGSDKDGAIEKLGAKASEGFSSMSWLFDSATSGFVLLLAIATGPFIVACGIAAAPFVLVHMLFFDQRNEEESAL